MDGNGRFRLFQQYVIFFIGKSKYQVVGSKTLVPRNLFLISFNLLSIVFTIDTSVKVILILQIIKQGGKYNIKSHLRSEVILFSLIHHLVYEGYYPCPGQ